MRTVSEEGGEGGEGVNCEWGRRGGCGLGVGKEGRVWTVSGEGVEGADCEWGMFVTQTALKFYVLNETCLCR